MARRKKEIYLPHWRIQTKPDKPFTPAGGRLHSIQRFDTRMAHRMKTTCGIEIQGISSMLMSTPEQEHRYLVCKRCRAMENKMRDPWNETLEVKYDPHKWDPIKNFNKKITKKR